MGPVIEILLRDGRSLSYLTSDPGDPGLTIESPGLRAFHIGASTVRTALFRRIECDHLVMTLPDLDRLWLKRSGFPGVHYVYMFHSLNSTHTAYLKGAFDAYDTVLSVGPHHVEEIRAAEAVYGLKEKELIEHGSVKLDSVLARYGDRPVAAGDGSQREVLVAPSWGETSLAELPVGRELIDTLVQGGYRTVLRLHPMTGRRLPELVQELKEAYEDEPLFRLEEDMNSTASWLSSDVMISDWSGAATEYAFALQKPVIYVNTPQKIRNPDWEAVGRPPFEEAIRHEIGRVVEPSDVATVPSLVDEACERPEQVRERALAARDRWVFNVGRSAEVAAQYLASLEPGR
jgi:hypothetical protein